MIDEIRLKTNRGLVVGTDEFVKALEKKLNRSLKCLCRRRPEKGVYKKGVCPLYIPIRPYTHTVPKEEPMKYQDIVVVKRWIPILKEYERTKAKITPRPFKFVKNFCQRKITGSVGQEKPIGTGRNKRHGICLLNPGYLII
ncbi:MAG: hypothetical protein KAS99_03815 [Candidatus Omnitrophica bacterium]|nr:hypothetical protein [Candidatus Omnitrophota bacterium]